MIDPPVDAPRAKPAVRPDAQRPDNPHATQQSQARTRRVSISRPGSPARNTGRGHPVAERPTGCVELLVRGAAGSPDGAPNGTRSGTTGPLLDPRGELL